jgi:hypothetical protein
MLGAVILVAMAAVSFGAAGAAGLARGGLACPVRARGEADKAYVDRAHDFCEARWSDSVATGRAGGLTHDGYVNACSRRCAGRLGDMVTGARLAEIAGALAVAGGAVALTKKEAPASP